MFCPSCGHEQLNEEIRFCSRCGFSFEVVGQLLDHNGYLPPELEEASKRQNTRFTRSTGLKIALIWFLGLFLLAPVAQAARAAPLAQMFAALSIFGGLFILVFSFLFLKKAQRLPKAERLNPLRKMKEPIGMRGSGNKNVLPPQQTVPAAAYVQPPIAGKTLDTFDLKRPGSVTEGTTQLLEKEK
jgi:hypothetical protein